MRKIIFWMLIVLTYYLAGMYHTQMLLLLCIAELIIFMVSAVLPFLFRKNLEFSFSERSMTSTALSGNTCCICVRNKGKLPAGAYKLRLTSFYEEQIEQQTKVKGYSRSREDEQTVEIHTPYCGLYRIAQEQVRIYDYFGMFSRKKKLSDTAYLAVFPTAQALQIQGEWTGMESEKAWEKLMGSRRDHQPEEFLQTREYQQGDSLRHVHWNQSARTDQLWTREYRDNTDNRQCLVLEQGNWKELDTEERSAFYILLSALLLGLLEKVDEVQVYWCKKGQWMQTAVGTLENCRKLLLELYRLAEDEESVSFLEGNSLKGYQEYQTFFRLDQNLRWYVNNKMIYHFSVSDLQQEIREKIF